MLVVVVPTHRAALQAHEKVAWKSITATLHNREIVWVGPDSLPRSAFARLSGFRYITFPAEYFVSRLAYSRLLLSEEFFRTFLDYSHILITQLDTLLLSDCLQTWMKSDFDFVGAPLRSGYGLTAAHDFGPGLNGGLSLRRPDAALRVLTSTQLRRISFRQAFSMESDFSRRIVRSVRDGILFNFADRPARLRRPRINEDLYWSHLVPAAHPWFSVPRPDVAQHFAVDASNRWPREHYEKLEGLVGIHAFQKLPEGVVDALRDSR